MEKFNRYLYIFIFSMISLLVFILQMEPCSSFYLNNNNAIVNFFSEIYYSLEKFDIIYVSLYIFILYFYSKVYFDNQPYENKNLGIIFAFIFSIITVVSKSFNLNNYLVNLISSPGQVCKTIIYLLGYYLIYYALLKKVLTFKFSSIRLKKKDH